MIHNNLENAIKNNKIAILADIHSNCFLLKKALQDIEERGIQDILFLGDYITDGFENNQVIDIIKKYKYVIAGNRDLSVSNYDGVSWDNLVQYKNMLYAYNNITRENLNYLKALPHYKIITLNNKKICLSHGTPFNNRDLVYHNSFNIFDKLISSYNCDIYLSAHTHEAYYTTYKNKVFINPGSITLPSDSPTSKYGILDLKNMVYEQVSTPYDFTELRNYYLNTDYFKNNREWCNILFSVNETGIDYICKFIDFINEKAVMENINIKNNIPNSLWNAAFLEFIKINMLNLY